MGGLRAPTLFGQVERLFGAGTVAGMRDGQLLELFLANRDDLAFQALLARHGPMVLARLRILVGVTLACITLGAAGAGVLAHQAGDNPAQAEQTATLIGRIPSPDPSEPAPQDAVKHAANQALPAGVLAQFEDDVELLQIQLQAKRAELEVEKVRMTYRKSLVDARKKFLAEKAISQTLWIEREYAAQLQEAQVQIKEAEVLEAQIRLEQAKRRLTTQRNSAAASVAPSPNSPSDLERRFRALEQKVDKIQRDLESMKTKDGVEE